jgi:hypothetical protein
MFHPDGAFDSPSACEYFGTSFTKIGAGLRKIHELFCGWKVKGGNEKINARDRCREDCKVKVNT